MSAGLLRERVVFEQRITDQDGAGNFEGAWSPAEPVAARIRSLKGGESVIGQRLQGLQPVVITVRSSVATRAVTTAWRARNTRSGETFNITAVTPGERPDYIDVLAQSGGADG